MSAPSNKLYWGRIGGKGGVITLTVLLVIAGAFWSTSRYPSLGEKAAEGAQIRLKDPLAFEVVFRVDPHDPIVHQIASTTGNWISANRQGMFFGVLFGAGFMTLFALVKQRSLRGSVANTFLGMAIGAPLGVCVNCAAPIARGLHAVGARLETTLATMVSSPTLNIVVITMTFSLLPFYMALMKVAATLFFLVFVIPFLCRYVLRQETLVSQENAAIDSPVCSVASREPLAESPAWSTAFGWFASSYCKNLWFIIVRVTVPLMLLSAVLGAVVVTLLPWDSWMGEVYELSFTGKLLRIVLLALFGLFLPVPIAFDVVVCATLLAAGMPVREVMVLLFTLGIYSVYSFTIIGRAVSWKVSIVMAGAVLAVALGISTVAHVYEKWHESRVERLYQDTSSALPALMSQAPIAPATDADALVRDLADSALEFASFDLADDVPGITLESRSFTQKAHHSGPVFERITGSTVGIDYIKPVISAFKYIPPNDGRTFYWERNKACVFMPIDSAKISKRSALTYRLYRANASPASLWWISITTAGLICSCVCWRDNVRLCSIKRGHFLKEGYNHFRISERVWC